MSFSSAAQSTAEQAKNYYYAAEFAHKDKNYADALVALNKVENIMGKSGAKLAALRVKIYSEQQQWTKAKKSLNAFYAYSPSQRFIRAMSPYLIKIDKKLAEQQRAHQIKQEKIKSERLAQQRLEKRLREERIAEQERLRKEKVYQAEQRRLQEKREKKQQLADLRKAKLKSKSPSKYSALPTDIVAFRGLVFITGPGQKEGDIWLMNITGKTRELNWEFNYSHSDSAGNRINLWPASIFVGGYKGIFIAGKATNSITNADTGFVAKIDMDGKLLWLKQYQHVSNKSRGSFEDIINVSGDSLILTGQTTEKEKANQVWVVNLDHYGDQIWNKTFGGDGDEHGYSATATQNNDRLLIAATTDSKGAGNDDAWLLQLDYKGAVIWEKTYGGATLDIVKGTAADKLGNYYLSGVSLDESGQRRIWTFKINSKGKLQWDKKIEGFSGYSIHRTKDDNMIIGGLGKRTEKAGKPLSAIKISKQGSVIWRQDKFLPNDHIWPSRTNILAVDDVFEGYYMTALTTKSSSNWVQYFLEPEG